MRANVFAAILAVLLCPSPVSAAEVSSAVYFTPGGEAPKPITFGDSMVREIAAARKGSSFPKPGTSVVPVRLHELVMDLAVVLGDRQCKNHRFLEVTPAKTRPGTESSSRPIQALEIWVTDACGTKAAYLIALLPCKNLPGHSVVAVSRAHQRSPRPIFYGANPLDASLPFPSCDF
jgi:hypothetical protein